MIDFIIVFSLSSSKKKKKLEISPTAPCHRPKVMPDLSRPRFWASHQRFDNNFFVVL